MYIDKIITAMEVGGWGSLTGNFKIMLYIGYNKLVVANATARLLD